MSEEYLKSAREVIGAGGREFESRHPDYRK